MLEKFTKTHASLHIILASLLAMGLPIFLDIFGNSTVQTAHADTLSSLQVTAFQEATAEASEETTTEISDTNTITDLSVITNTLALTIPTPIENGTPLTDTPEIDASSNISDSTPQPQSQEDSVYSSIISGTVIANRTEQQALFFVEGATYLLDPLRSIGLQLPRSTAAVNLYNCDAKTPEDQENCFWDPYLLTRDGFYEIVSGSDAGKTVSLVLREVGLPPNNRVFIQNRTGRSETIFFGGQEIQIDSASLKEFDVQGDAPTLLYLQNCISLGGEVTCEWSPRAVTPGLYYAMVEQVTPGSVPNSQRITIELEEVLAAGSNTTPEPTAPQVTCRTLVPTLNVRSGPGLQYTIIQKVRIGGTDPASVIAVGRDESAQWLAVDDKIAPGGWVIASNNFLQCEGDVAALPIIQPTIAELQPTPLAATPAQEESSGSEAPATDETTPEESATGENPASASVPEGYALLVVNNGFEFPIRFTLDQQYRMELGPSEFDLEPGGSVQIVVVPGQIAFTASSPGRSGNADFLIEKDQTRVLWLTFIIDPGSDGKWILQY